MAMNPDERVFEALWMPRWFGQDQSVAHGQEGEFDFRGVAPDQAGLTLLAAGLDRPRYKTQCRVLGLKHDQLGRLQAITFHEGTYRFVRHDGEVIVVDAEGGDLREGLETPPADWTVRVIFEAID